MTGLSVKNLSVELSGKTILNAVSLSARPGEIIGLIGPNGAGKTTLLRAIMGFVPAQGEIFFDGQNAAKMSARDRAHHLAYLPQEREVAWPVSVEMLVSLGRSSGKAFFAGLNSQDRALIETALESMDIVRFRKRPVTELSGGERARVLIARMLAQAAPILLADEPVAGLDPAHQLSLMQHFAKLATLGKMIVVSLHDLSLAARSCSRLILLDQGHVVADGTPAQVLTAQHLRQTYGIDAHIAQMDGQLIVHPKSVIPKHNQSDGE